MINRIMLDDQSISDIVIADSFLKRLRGYMFRKEPHCQAIVFKPCNSIHTFFMKFDIDVLFIDENMEVIKKVEGIKPGNIIKPVKKAKMVIEAKAGLFKNYEEGNIVTI